MKWPVLTALAACVATLAGMPARAADSAPAAREASAAAPAPVVAAPALPRETPADDDAPPATGRKSEPAIQRTVIEDRGTRIEELRVRGQLQKITVDLKGHAPNYEILLGDGAHVVGDDPGTSRGSAGKRVWNLLRF
jgi:hypothetical protein